MNNQNKPLRLNKYLAGLGVASRRTIDNLISGGNITINGRKAILGQKILPTDEVKINGNIIITKSREILVYLVNKPTGYVSTSNDEYGRRSVISLVPGDVRLFPVGRLDKDTSGLILLTNDGDLTQKLTHPKFEIEKEYHIFLSNPLSTNQIEEIKGGVEDERENYRVDRIESIGRCKYSITLHEGKKREIRRIIGLIGASLITLKRVRIGNLELGELKEGDFRLLSPEEIKNISG